MKQSYNQPDQPWSTHATLTIILDLSLLVSNKIIYKSKLYFKFQYSKTSSSKCVLTVSCSEQIDDNDSSFRLRNLPGARKSNWTSHNIVMNIIIIIIIVMNIIIKLCLKRISCILMRYCSVCENIVCMVRSCHCHGSKIQKLVNTNTTSAIVRTLDT